MSSLLGLLSIILLNLALAVPGFLAAYILRFRSHTWGAVSLSLGVALVASGWLASFSVAGFVLILLGITLLDAGASGMAFAGRAAR